MRLTQILFSQGFGTRRVCVGLVANGLVAWQGRVLDDPKEELASDGLVLNVQGHDWPYRERALIMLHKPAGYECSQKPRHHPSVMSLLPEPLRQRGVQPIGRLDEDTTGLLLLTDDGTLIHRWTSPKHHVPKVYEIGLRHPPTAQQVAALLGGVVLDDEPTPVRAAVLSFVVNLGLSLALMESLGTVGLAIAGNVAVVAQAIYLQRRLAARDDGLRFAHLWSDLGKIVVAGAAMGVLVAGGWWAWGRMVPPTYWGDAMGLLVLIGAGGASYAGLLWAMRIEGRQDLAAAWTKLRAKLG